MELELRPDVDALRRQAEIARSAGRTELGESLERAAELATVPADVILEVYTALRPHRSTAEELDDWAERLEREYRARLCADFVREARAVYVRRALLATRERAPI